MRDLKHRKPTERKETFQESLNRIYRTEDPSPKFSTIEEAREYGFDGTDTIEDNREPKFDEIQFERTADEIAEEFNLDLSHHETGRTLSQLLHEGKISKREFVRIRRAFERQQELLR